MKPFVSQTEVIQNSYQTTTQRNINLFVVKYLVSECQIPFHTAVAFAFVMKQK
jgi:hypothetical protein